MKYELVCLARKKLQGFGKHTTPERFIYDAHEWNERMVSLFTIQHEFEDALYKDILSDVIEDYCLAILSERSIPIWADIENQLIVCGENSHLDNVK